MTRTMPRQRKPMKRSPIRRVSSKQRKRLATWAKVTLARMVRVGNRCERCGTTDSRLVGHHRLPRGQGGEDTDQNCIVMCDFCHQTTHANPAESYAIGWMLRRGDEGAP